MDEEILHFYHKCNNCGYEPIWGTRFKCDVCQDYDLCEQCYDLFLNEKFTNVEEEKKKGIKKTENFEAKCVKESNEMSGFCHRMNHTFTPFEVYLNLNDIN